MKQQMRNLLNVAMAIFIATMAMTPTTAWAGGRHRAGTKLEEVKGVVIRASAQFLTIRTASGDRDVRVTPETVVTSDHRQISASMINIGDKVEAQVRKNADGTYTALAIKIDDPHAAKEIEGIVRSVSPSSITVITSKGEVVVALTADTKFLINERPSTLSVVAAGMRVEVETLRRADGTLVALVVKIESKPVKIEGVVTSISATSMTVRKRDGDEVVVNLTPTTIVRRHGTLVSASTIAVGARVEVEAVKNADQSLTALLIETHAEDELAQIKGVVTSVGTDQLVVKTRSGDEVTVMVTSDTIIRIDDRRVLLSSIHVGDHVEIEAQQNANGTFTAVRIEVDDEEHLVEIEGVITAISGSAITIRTEHRDEVVVMIGAQTRIRRDHEQVSVAALHVGDRVEVKAERNPDGSLTAVEIKLEDDDDDETVEIKGVVTAVSPSSVTVRLQNGTTITVAMTENTVVKKHDRRATIADVRVGQRVEIKATRKPDGSFTAVVIEIEEDHH